jgi:trehalose/maltose hydrolase-like predicted phosphorylase
MGRPTFQAKQADTLMLQYPLMFNHSTLTPASKLNDLLFYANHSLISPDMTQSIYSIVANELDQQQLAHSLFNLSYQRFNFAPYYTWSEKADGTGNVPYLTSGGGFLQSITYGYAGLRAMSGRLRLRPQLIEGVSRMALRRIAYCGERIDIEYNASWATVTRVTPSATTGDEGRRVVSTRLRIATEAVPDGAVLPATFATGQVAHVLCAPP